MIIYKAMSLSDKLNPYKLFASLKRDNYNYVLYLIFVFAIFYIVMPRQYYKLTNSILGKLIALALVMYLTSINIVAGLLAAIVIIFSYDTLIEGMENKEDQTKLDVEIKKSNEEHTIEKQKITELKEGKDIASENMKKELEKEKQPYTAPYVNEAIARFKMDHCLNGKVVKNNMAEIKLSDLKEYFPQISFDGKDICNPCDPSCNFKMTTFDERITVEEKLRPVDTTTVSVS